MPNWVTNTLDIRADGARMKEVLEAIKHDDGKLGSLDFNKLIPMPKELELTQGSVTDRTVEAFISNLALKIKKSDNLSDIEHASISQYLHAASYIFRRSFHTPNIHLTEKEIAERAEQNNMSVDDLLALGKKYLDNQIKYGAPTWYSWCTENWGTKWNLNANDCELVSKQSLSFHTAWSAPQPVIKALSQKFPDIEFAIQWADEDLGNNVGMATYKNGEIVNAYIPEPYSKEAYELAFEIECAEPEDFSMTYDVKSGTYVYSDELEAEEDYDVHEEAPDLDNKLDAAKGKSLAETSYNSSPIEKDPER